MFTWIIYQGRDFTGKYMVSTKGEVRSVDRHSKTGQFYKGRIIKQRNGRKRSNSNPYKMVTLWDNGKQVDVEVHRLVANAFLENPQNLPCVNHIDGNPANNDVLNLEWCSYSDNVRHSINVLGNNPAKWRAKAVLQKDLDGNVVKEWESAWEIQRQLGINQVNISRCCRREKKSGIFAGFIWDFKGGD